MNSIVLWRQQKFQRCFKNLLVLIRNYLCASKPLRFWWTYTLLALHFSVPEAASRGRTMRCSKTTNVLHVYVAKLLWAGILINSREKPQSGPRIQRNTHSAFCSVFSSTMFPPSPPFLFLSFSLYWEGTQILITWWDYILCPCVCNRACGFSYNLHEPL